VGLELYSSPPYQRGEEGAREVLWGVLDFLALFPVGFFLYPTGTHLPETCQVFEILQVCLWHFPSSVEGTD
jgi:hypothetical protein